MRIILFLLAALLLDSPCSNAAESVTYDIGHGPQLFLDDFLLAKQVNAWRRIEEAHKHPANPLLVAEYPWEASRPYFFGGVMYDEEMQRFRLWYTAYGPKWQTSGIACAESNDGVHWRKPMFDMHPYPGYPRINIVLAQPRPDSARAFMGPHEGDPARRFKALMVRREGRITACYSPDGIHFVPDRCEEVVTEPGFRDHGINALWSERLGKYMLHLRGWEPPPVRGVPRNVNASHQRVEKYLESGDFRNWTPEATVLRFDARDGGVAVQPYSPCVVEYGDVFVMLLTLLHIEEIRGTQELGYLDVQLAVSRDGKKWSRAGNRRTFIPVGRAGEWDDEEIRIGQTFVVRNDTMYFYYNGMTHPHATGSPAAIGLATLPADRFVGVGVTQVSERRLPKGAEAGEALLVNAGVPAAGDLALEILDRAGRTVQGYSARECRLRRHDALRYEVTWAGRGLDECPARQDGFAVRFLLQGGARLYAFQVRKE